MASGSRVVVAARGEQIRRLREAVTTADQAARETDAFAVYTGVKPARYRVYPAGDAEWKSWYGGKHRTGPTGMP